MSDKSGAILALNCAQVLFALVVLPLWYYLLYQVLDRVEANTAMWVIYWIYLPCSVASATLSELVKLVKKECGK